MRGLGFAAEPVVIADRYELLERIGRGGHGTVYEAFDRDLRRRVAVKVLELGDPDEAKREGQALAIVDHPNVVKIHDHGQGSDYRYYVLQLLDGPTLRAWCADKIPQQIVAKYVEAARGLEAAHQAGLVHRDFKPSNVRIGSKGQAVVVDFGLARHLASLEADSDERAVVVGTIAYAPPERLLGQIGDERSDQWSFCVALWEALAGVNPFGSCDEETTPAQRYASIQAGLRGEPRGPKHVRRALECGLAISPADRFASVGDLTSALADRPRRRRWMDIAVIGIGTILISLLATTLIPHDQAAEPVVSAEFTRVAELAVAQAHAGDGEGALQLLEAAQRRNPSPDDALALAVAGRRVAEELERRGLVEDAMAAWAVTIVLARASGDEQLIDESQQRLRDVTAPRHGSK